MSDSLRDQLIAAGYDAPKPKPQKKSKPGSKAKGKGKGPNQNTGKGQNRSKKTGTRPPGKRSSSKPAKPEEDPQLIAERKQLKAQIKALIDEHKATEWQGEVVYRYLVDKKIRELYVNDVFQKRLAERELAVTRLNGETYLVGTDIGLKIKEINPQWSVFNLTADDTDTSSDKADDDYAGYQVPDDLKW